MRQQFQERLKGVDDEMKEIDSTLDEMLDIFSSDFNGLIQKIDNVKRLQGSIINER